MSDFKAKCILFDIAWSSTECTVTSTILLILLVMVLKMTLQINIDKH